MNIYHPEPDKPASYYAQGGPGAAARNAENFANARANAEAHDAWKQNFKAYQDREAKALANTSELTSAPRVGDILVATRDLTYKKPLGPVPHRLSIAGRDGSLRRRGLSRDHSVVRRSWRTILVLPQPR